MTKLQVCFNQRTKMKVVRRHGEFETRNSKKDDVLLILDFPSACSDFLSSIYTLLLIFYSINYET